MKSRGKRFKEKKSLKSKQQLNRSQIMNVPGEKKYQSETLETGYDKHKNKSEQFVTVKQRINDYEINISYKEHFIIIGIGVIFSILLYLVSFFV